MPGEWELWGKEMHLDPTHDTLLESLKDTLHPIVAAGIQNGLARWAL